MIVGQGNSFIQPNTATPPTVFPPFPINAADNGLSVDPVTGEIVLGQALAEPGDPARLLSNREIPLNGFLYQIGTGATRFLISEPADLSQFSGQNFQLNAGGFFMQRMNQSIGRYQFGDISGFGNSQMLAINDATGFNQLGDVLGNFSGGVFENLPSDIAMGDTGGLSTTANLNINFASSRMLYQNGLGDFIDIAPALGRYRIGDITGILNNTHLEVDDTNNRFEFSNAALNAALMINGVLGFTGTVAPVASITVDGGIVTAVT